MAMIEPRDQAELADAIADAAAQGRSIELRGGGSKAAIGAERPDATLLSMRGFAGIVDYDPPELVLTLRPGTPLAEVEALVAGEGQMLAFEPFDHGPVFGQPAGVATIGGVIAAGVAGSRRLTAGGARDHLLGFHGVSGRGEAFVAGAKVVKNVTGYDLSKLVTGSWGQLVALTEITLKVLPRPTATATRVVLGLDPAGATAAMAAAMRGQAEVSAAAYLPADLAEGTSITAFRLEGFGPSVAARCTMLQAILAQHGRVAEFSESVAQDFWQAIRTLAPLDDGRPLWRINTPPSAGPRLGERLASQGARWIADWAGGLVWLTFDHDPATVRRAAEAAGGHATLVRAPAALRAVVPALHPPAPGVAALSARIRRAFDPLAVFETGRFLDASHAD